MAQRSLARTTVRELAEWWTQASEEARWLLLRQTIDVRQAKGQTPSLGELQLAIYLAEAEAGEVEAGSAREGLGGR